MRSGLPDAYSITRMSTTEYISSAWNRARQLQLVMSPLALT